MKKTMLLSTILFTLFLIGCNNNSSNDNIVRVGHFPNVTHAQALIGSELGLFEKHLGDAVAINYYVFNAGPAEIEAFFAGELDLGYIGPVPASNGNIKSNGDIVILAGASNAGAMILVSENSNINDISDLNGKKIAIPQIGNTQHLSLL